MAYKKMQRNLLMQLLLTVILHIFNSSHTQTHTQIIPNLFVFNWSLEELKKGNF